MWRVVPFKFHFTANSVGLNSLKEVERDFGLGFSTVLQLHHSWLIRSIVGGTFLKCFLSGDLHVTHSLSFESDFELSTLTIGWDLNYFETFKDSLHFYQFCEHNWMRFDHLHIKGWFGAHRLHLLCSLVTSCCHLSKKNHGKANRESETALDNEQLSRTRWLSVAEVFVRNLEETYGRRATALRRNN